MSTFLSPLEQCFTSHWGERLALPPELEAIYGPLGFPPAPPGRPYVISNFVETLDGVAVAHADGTSLDISGANPHDHLLMGLLRACADAVIVGAGTLRDAREHLWTPDYIYPPLASAYRSLRQGLGKPGQPLNVIVSASGNIDLELPVFHTPSITALVITTRSGEQRLRTQALPPAVRIATGGDGKTLSAHAILAAIERVLPCERLLVEGGPALLAALFAEHLVDELFLTLAPQLAGRSTEEQRPGMVSGRLFLPNDPRWGRLISLKRADSYLFLRYAFSSPTTQR